MLFGLDKHHHEWKCKIWNNAEMLTTLIISVSDLYPQIIIIHLSSLKGVILLCDKTCSFFGGGGGEVYIVYCFYLG